MRPDGHGEDGDFLPFGRWSSGRKLAVTILILSAMGLGTPIVLHNFQNRQSDLIDFVQDWCSAREALEGRPIYSSLRVAAARHGVRTIADDQPSTVEVNGHPPTSVLYVLPLAAVDFSIALFAWKTLGLACVAASIALFFVGYGVRLRGWSFAAIAGIFWLCPPLWVNLSQGQWSGLLLLLTTLAWLLAVRGRNGVSGAALGLACGVKLFPAMLLVCFASRRRLVALIGWSATLGVLTAAAAWLFGQDSFSTYAEKVVPDIRQFVGHPLNASIEGFWSRLFDPTRRDPSLIVEPFRRDPALAGTLTLASLAILAAALGWRIWRSRKGPIGPTIGSAASAMLLAAPLTWDHSLLLASLPLGIVWMELRGRPARWWTLPILLGLWTPTMVVDLYWNILIGAPPHQGPYGWSWSAGPAQALAIFSIPHYALWALFAIGVWTASRETLSDATGKDRPARPPEAPR